MTLLQLSFSGIAKHFRVPGLLFQGFLKQFFAFPKPPRAHQEASQLQQEFGLMGMSIEPGLEEADRFLPLILEDQLGGLLSKLPHTLAGSDS